MCLQYLCTHVKLHIKTKQCKGRQFGVFLCPLLMKHYNSWHRPADLWPHNLSMCALFARPGMGRIRAWTLLSKPIVAGFLCWLQSPNTLCFAVRMAFWCLGLLLGLADLIYMIFLCCGTSSDLPFFLQPVRLFSHFPYTSLHFHLLWGQLFGPCVIAESRLRVLLFAVPALKHRQFILGSPDFQFLSLHSSGQCWVLHFVTTTSFLALPVVDFTRSKRHSCKCLDPACIESCTCGTSKAEISVSKSSLQPLP